MNLTGAKHFFWSMLWVVVALIVFVAIAQFVQNRNVPVLSSVFGWAQSHAGLEQ